LAAALKQEPGVEVEMVDGNRGELTVLVDGRQVAKKDENSTPSAAQVLAAVKDTEHATAG
jgi:hypothetical protein